MSTPFDAQAAAVFDTAREQRTNIYREKMGAQGALQQVEKELADLLPPAALRKLRALQEHARADRMQAYAEVLSAGNATDDQVREAFGRAYQAQQRAICLTQKA
jgi:hypothetical protein